MIMNKTTLIQETINDLCNQLDIVLVIDKVDLNDEGCYNQYCEDDYSSPGEPYELSEAVGDAPEVLATAYMNLGWD